MNKEEMKRILKQDNQKLQDYVNSLKIISKQRTDFDKVEIFFEPCKYLFKKLQTNFIKKEYEFFKIMVEMTIDSAKNVMISSQMKKQLNLWKSFIEKKRK